MNKLTHRLSLLKYIVQLLWQTRHINMVSQWDIFVDEQGNERTKVGVCDVLTITVSHEELDSYGNVKEKTTTNDSTLN